MRGTLRLGDHCLKIGSGATPRGGKEAYLTDGPYSLIRSQNVLNDRFSIGGLAFISQEQADQLSNVEVQPNDVLLNITGDSVARVCQVDPVVLPARVNQHVAIIRPQPEVIDPRFLRYFMVSPEMQAHMLGLAASGATRNALTKGMIEKFEIPAVPLPEQRAIAATLGALDDKIELNRKMNATLEAMARALFRDWFVDFGPTRAKMEARAPYLYPDLWALFPDRLDDEGKPEEWAFEPLLDQAEWVNGAAYKNMHFSDDPDALPVIKIAELKNGVTGATQRTATDLGARYLIDDGELLFSWSGNPDTSIDTFLWTGGKAWLNQHIFAVRPNGKRSKPYLHALLKFLKPEFAELARNKQTTGLGHVTKADMQRMMVCAASPEVHNAFDRLIEPIFNQALGLQTETRTLAQTRDLLLPRLMSGELRVADLASFDQEAVA
ncbi:restriction endonuclease subunit S [Rhodovulum euryhalinum]|nr:restriction endonuclease subunit S [Rhodovulum euryhalinum]